MHAEDTLVSLIGAARDDPASNLSSWKNDENWKGCCYGRTQCGCIYYGVDDTRLCVRRRCVRCSPPLAFLNECACLLPTVNVGHRYGYAVYGFVILLLLLGEGISWAVTIFGQKL
jgi:hypothetical protein